MDTPDGFEAMAEACIANHEAIMRYGSSEMRTAARLLLFALGEEMRRRETEAARAPEPVVGEG